MKYIFPIILLLPFALQAMPATNQGAPHPTQNQPTPKQEMIERDAKILVSVYLYNAHSGGRYRESFSFAQDGQLANPLLSCQRTLGEYQATATVNVLGVTERAATIECTLSYRHINNSLKSRLFPCLVRKKYVDETILRTAEVEMGQEMAINFGNSDYPKYKDIYKIIPSYGLATLTLAMSKIKNNN